MSAMLCATCAEGGTMLEWFRIRGSRWAAGFRPGYGGPARRMAGAGLAKRFVADWSPSGKGGGFLLGLVVTEVVLVVVGPAWAESKRYDYNWESLKTHPIPQWFDDAKFGIFIHWGPYSVLGYRKGGRGYAEHVPKEIYRNPDHYYGYLRDRFGAAPPAFGYKDIVPRFRAERWDPDAWAALFQKAGARYVVLTAEHHDGYALWDSALTPWCATKVGPMRDLVGDLGAAVRKRGMKYAPSYHRERHPGFFARQLYALRSLPHPDIAEEIERMPKAADLYGPFEYSDAFIEDYVARWKEIERKYRPDLMWLDHVPVFHKRWCKDSDDPQIRKFHAACMRMIADYYNAAEGWGMEVCVNNKGPDGAHNWPLGIGFREADNLKLEGVAPKWENPATLGTSYGYMKAEEQRDGYKSPAELIHLLCDVVSKNGNLLLNIGPRADGTIPQGMQRRLLAIGEWLAINGEAIYGTRPWRIAEQREPNLRFTTKGETLYAIALERPTEPFVLPLDGEADIRGVTGVSLLGSDEPVRWSTVKDGIRIHPPAKWPGNHAWTFRVESHGDGAAHGNGH